MKASSRFKALLEDPLFLRVCMGLWSTPFIAPGGFAVGSWRPQQAWEWCSLAVLVAIGCLGLHLLAMALLGSDARVRRAIDFMSEGGELPGFVLAIAVIVVAIPLTLAIRAAKGNRT